MVAMVAQARALKPRIFEVAPSNMNFKSPESPATVAGAVAVAVAGNCL
jgi:hypothetical protein